jgi:Fe-S-cluster containining protein
MRREGEMERFWSEGLRFECQGSGHCCTSRGEYGYVYLTRQDRRVLADHLKLTLPELKAKHLEVTDGHVHFKDPDKDCVFLDGKRCSIYEARPTQCRTWPFWPENMSAKAWSAEVESACAGVGKGRVWSAKEIDELVQLGHRSTKA